MGKRLFKVLVIFGYFIIIAGIITSVIKLLDGVENIHPPTVILIMGFSLIPLGLLMVIQYIVFGSMSLSYVFKSKKYISAFIKIIALALVGVMVYTGVVFKHQRDNAAFMREYQDIRNDTFVDYNKKGHPSFSDMEHRFLFDLIHAPHEVNTSEIDTFSDEVINIASTIEKAKSREDVLMQELAVDLGYKSIRKDKRGWRWVETKDGKFLKWGYDIVKKGKQ